MLLLALILYTAIASTVTLRPEYVRPMCVLGMLTGMALADRNPNR